MKAKESFGITFYLNDEEFRYIPRKKNFEGCRGSPPQEKKVETSLGL
jgi:hypothetical protein